LKRAFDLSKWDNIDLSDDETTFHPNIENNFNIKINRTVRDRREQEEEDLREKLIADGSPESLQELEKLDRNKKWHVGNICHVAEERTIVNEYKKPRPRPKKDGVKDDAPEEFLPGAMTGVDHLMEFKEWKGQHLPELEGFVDVGGDYDRTHQLLQEKGELLLDEETINHTHTYCMLECLEMMVQDNKNRAKKCAQQSQLCSHIIELSKTFKRPPRDLVNRWFERTTEDSPARQAYEDDVKMYLEKVTKMAVEKRALLEKERKEAKEAQEAAEAEMQANERWVSKKAVEEGTNTTNIDESVEPQPLIKVMYRMSKEERLACAPGGLDPIEVFEALPEPMREAFMAQDVPKLVQLQETMPLDQFGYHLTQCIKAGLWQSAAGSEEEEGKEGEEEEEGVPEKDAGPSKSDDSVIEEIPNHCSMET